MNAPVPRHEKKRLKVLWEYQVLDSIPEEVFDDLTELAARICEAPIALITLVDEDRQWFKSRVGLTAERDFARFLFVVTLSARPSLYCAGRDQGFPVSRAIPGDSGPENSVLCRGAAHFAGRLCS
jgi:hypothetical protein